MNLVRVRTRHDDIGMNTYVPGYNISQGLALHQEVLREGYSTSWDITHIASGLSILPCTFATKEQAVRCIEELVKPQRGIDWTLPATRLQRHKKLPDIIKQCVEWAINEIVIVMPQEACEKQADSVIL